MQKKANEITMSINPPRATAIITAYNAERYVSRAIESALNQSFGPLHVIVVDDGSSDKTSEVARSYGDSVELIQLEENSGSAVGRTTGLMNCKTEFMAFRILIDALRREHTYQPLSLNPLKANLIS